MGDSGDATASRTGLCQRPSPVRLGWVALVLATVALALLPATAAAPTPLPSTITQDTTLTAEGSPYTSSGPVTVNAGVTLTIQPGVKIQIGGSSSSLVVNGTLNAQGTAAN